MSGEFLYCQNTSCGVYLGSLGGSSCEICGWQAGEQEPACRECGERGCNGECYGDDMMGGE